MRQELAKTPLRVAEVCPGLVRTEFSLVRFRGDQARADAVYQGITPLTATDIAEVIRWVASQPDHVAIDEVVIRPKDQVSSTEINRHLPEK